MGEINIIRSQMLRERCNHLFRRDRVPEIVGALQMLTADTLMWHPDLSEQDVLDGARAIASDIESIIRERFAMRGKPS